MGCSSVVIGLDITNVEVELNFETAEGHFHRIDLP